MLAADLLQLELVHAQRVPAVVEALERVVMQVARRSGVDRVD